MENYNEEEQIIDSMNQNNAESIEFNMELSE